MSAARSSSSAPDRTSIPRRWFGDAADRVRQGGGPELALDTVVIRDATVLGGKNLVIEPGSPTEGPHEGELFVYYVHDDGQETPEAFGDERHNE